MQVAILTLDFHLEGCSSLKQKRQRLKGLKDRFGRLSHIAVCESDRADCLDKAQWSFAFLSQNKAGIASAVAAVREDGSSKVHVVGFVLSCS